ncbi:MAG: type IV secretory system conjugative DNA transfer family protein [Oscillospiraceae bacterium]|nr:type IV secretory system conjugative DNA transfer family protein [Oscillospiraceae bacterium]
MIPASLLLTIIFGAGLLLHLDQRQSPKPPRELLNVKPQGFIFGTYKSKYFIKSESSDGHILICGGAGSGKSSSLAIPSLLAWQSAIFAIDIKGELSAATADKPGERKIFNPMSYETWGFDPFYLLNNSDNAAQEAHEIAAALVPEPANVKDPFWIQSAQNLLTALLLHYHAAGLSFVETIKEILSKPVDLHVKYVFETTQNEAARLHMSQFYTLENKTLAGIFAEVGNAIRLFATDRHVIAALSKENNISPADLEQGIDIFLSIPEDKLDQWKPLFTLITNQFLKHFERRDENNARPILFLLDEFPRLGRIEPVVTGLTTLRSKKITIALIIQSLAQLDLLYGPAQRRVILDNCSYKAILGASDAETQEYFSRLVGTVEATRQGQSTSYAADGDEERGHTVSQHTVDRRIIQPHEFATLKDVVLLTPWGYFRAGKVRPDS